MRYWAVFYRMDLVGKLSEACGSDSVYRIDGRLSDRHMRAVAADECKRRGFAAWQIIRGRSLLDAQNATGVHRVDHLSNLQTISERINARGSA